MCKIADRLYLLSWGLYLFVTLWNHTFITPLFVGRGYTFLLCGCLLLLVIKEFMKFDFSFKTTIIAFFLVILGIMVYLFSAHKIFLVMCFFIFSARNIDYKTIVKISIMISSLVLFFVSVGALLGVVYNEVSFNIIDDRTRWYLGFTYVLIPVAIFSNIINLLMVYNKNELKWKYITLLIVINQILFEYTDSRLVYYLVCVNLIAVIILKTKARSLIDNNLFRNLFTWSMPLACVLAFYVTINYDPTDLYQYLINFVLEKRLELGQDALHTYGWSMFGSNIIWVGNGLDENGLKASGVYNYVDCAYIRILLDYGVISFVLFMGVVLRFMYEMKKNNHVIMMIIFSIMAIHNMIDDTAIMLQFNTCLLFLGYLIPSKYPQEMLFNNK